MPSPSHTNVKDQGLSRLLYFQIKLSRGGGGVRDTKCRLSTCSLHSMVFFVKCHCIVLSVTGNACLVTKLSCCVFLKTVLV